MSGYTDSLEGYVDVAERIAGFRARFPDGCLRPVDPAIPYRIEQLGELTLIVYAAAAYRGPDDALPAIGVASEPFPGRTPYTRGSELANAETSAWGRAIVAALAGDTRRAVASRQDVQARAAEGSAAVIDPEAAAQLAAAMSGRIAGATTQGLRALWSQVVDAERRGALISTDAEALRAEIEVAALTAWPAPAQPGEGQPAPEGVTTAQSPASGEDA